MLELSRRKYMSASRPYVGIVPTTVNSFAREAAQNYFAIRSDSLRIRVLHHERLHRWPADARVGRRERLA